MVNTYDFPSWALGAANAYGAYDIHRNQGFVNVGMTHDAAAFAVESLRWSWMGVGRRYYPQASRWFLCAESGGSNSSRSRAWKCYLQQLSNPLDIGLGVCHYPPGTSKWNLVEHRLLSSISLNWKRETPVAMKLL